MSFTLAKLQAAITGEEDKPAKGFKTAQEWADEWRVSPRTARERIAKALAILECRKYRRRAAGTIRPVPHYGPKRG